MKAVVDIWPDYTGIRLEGRFDRVATQEFRMALIDALRHDRTEIHIDLAAVEYIDSAALGLLLTAREIAETAGKTITLANASGMAKKVLDFAKFKSIFKIV